ncbi:B3/B4 domain-containing protein [Ureibacillus acetophenoni]|uniref:DNA/RNA-binding domain of Phe-tRNA-synthetase-like protein n=1 Tax=Ureibacillus acetophenoni TaxID=614649 RepID=A0A285UDM9_9BACL|nr:phenylalanine--tRNA ligase beta subunit-related protein [Ureibacillus acetophenoni]SOC40044.1 DNA/RNA-binding domain of Phe-tRNA-synthetase-like protein [Ureibacillus acetophenoni]
MKISIDPLIFETNSHFKIGIIHYTKIVVSESPQMIKGRTRLYQENLYFELQETSVTERPGIAEWRKVWKSFGADPNRYRHSAESLMRRIAKENYLEPFHLAVDLNNFFSLQYEIPIGIYDLTKIQGDVQVTVGNEETGYEGLNGRYNSLKNILCSVDDNGAFGSPFVDSKRTAVTEETTDALHIFYLRPTLSENECQELLQSAGKMFTQVSGGNYKPFILSSNEPNTLL